MILAVVCLHVEGVREHLVAGDNVLVDEHGAFVFLGVGGRMREDKDASERFAYYFSGWLAGSRLAGALPASGSAHLRTAKPPIQGKITARVQFFQK